MGNPFSSSTTQQQNQSQQQNSLQSFLNAFANQGTSATTPNENPMFTQFRESILPAIAAQYSEAQKPAYGAPEIAQAIQTGNKATTAAEQGNIARAARTGTLQAGNTAATNASLDAANTANITNFMNQIPFLNQQTAFDRTNSLLGLAAGFLGQSPIGQTTTSQQTGSNVGTNTAMSTSTGTGFGKTTGNPSIMSDIGSIAGIASGFVP